MGDSCGTIAHSFCRAGKRGRGNRHQPDKGWLEIMNRNPSQRPHRGFSLIEIMIVVSILGIILAIAGPTWWRQRLLSQSRVCQENMTKIDGAKEQWALENNKEGTAEPVWSDLVAGDGSGYLKSTPECPASGSYTIGAVETAARCTITTPMDHNQ